MQLYWYWLEFDSLWRHTCTLGKNSYRSPLWGEDGSNLGSGLGSGRPKSCLFVAFGGDGQKFTIRKYVGWQNVVASEKKKTKMKKRSVLLFLFPFIKLFIQHNQASIQWKAYTLGYTKILLVLSCSCETFSSYEIKKKIMLARKVSKYKCISTTAKSFTPEAW